MSDEEKHRFSVKAGDLILDNGIEYTVQMVGKGKAYASSKDGNAVIYACKDLTKVMTAWKT